MVQFAVKKRISLILLLFSVLLLTGVSFLYALPKVRTDYAKTLFPPIIGEDQFSAPLENRQTYRFSFPVVDGQEVQGFSLLFVTEEDAENAGTLAVTVSVDDETVTTAQLNASEIISYQWQEIPLDPPPHNTGRGYRPS